MTKAIALVCLVLVGVAEVHAAPIRELAPGMPSAIALYEDQLYWSESLDGGVCRIFATPRAGGKTKLVTSCRGDVLALAVVRDTLVWIELKDHDQYRSRLLAKKLAGGPIVDVVPDLSATGPLLTDERSVVLETAEELLRYSTDTGKATPIPTVAPPGSRGPTLPFVRLGGRFYVGRGKGLWSVDEAGGTYRREPASRGIASADRGGLTLLETVDDPSSGKNLSAELVRWVPGTAPRSIRKLTPGYFIELTASGPTTYFSVMAVPGRRRIFKYTVGEDAPTVLVESARSCNVVLADSELCFASEAGLACTAR